MNVSRATWFCVAAWVGACSAGGDPGRGAAGAGGSGAGGASGSSGGGGATGGSGGGGTGAIAFDAAPSDGSQSDSCGSTTVPSKVDLVPGNVLVVFDQSWTMNDPWTDPAGQTGPKVAVAGGALIAAISPIAFKLNAGAIFFPTTPAPGFLDLCPAEVAPIGQPPQIPIQQAAAFVAAWQQHFAPPWAAVLGTPLHKALKRADEALQSPPGTTVVVIFTDGHWTCGDGTEVMTVAGLLARGIKTYVVGLPGAYGIVGLDSLAQAGGTAAPGCSANCFFIPNDSKQLEAELAKIATTTVSIDSCVITLDPPPPDADNVHLVVRDQSGSEFEVPRSDGGSDGWTLSPDGKTATLTGSVCQDAKDGRFADLRFEYGCVALPPLR
jgi:hypothetical protein